MDIPQMALVVLLAIGGAVVAVSAATTIYAAVKTAPHMATSRRALLKILSFAGLQPDELLMDMGSGNGRVLAVAARDFGARARGVEFSLHHYLFSKVNLWARGLAGRTEVRWGDFYAADVADADLVFCWLTPRAMRKLEEKFAKELKPGARVVAYSTPLPTREPANTFVRSETETIYLYTY